MSKFTLYSGPLSMYGAKIQIAALEKGIRLEVVMVPFSQEYGYEPKHSEVIRINPKRQVPVLIHGDVELFDSTQIFEYFEHLNLQLPLWPAATAPRAQARLLELKSDEVFFPLVIRLMSLQAHLTEASAQEAIAQIHRLYLEWQATLATQDYLAGDYTYADIAFFMAQLFAARLGAPMSSATPELLAWRKRVATRPAVRPIVAQIANTLSTLNLPVPDFMLVEPTPAATPPPRTNVFTVQEFESDGKTQKKSARIGAAFPHKE